MTKHRHTSPEEVLRCLQCNAARNRAILLRRLEIVVDDIERHLADLDWQTIEPLQ